MSDVVNGAHNDGQNQVYSMLGVIGTLGTADVKGTAPTLPLAVNPDNGALYVDVMDTEFNVGTLNLGTINQVGTVSNISAGSIRVVVGTVNTGTINTGTINAGTVTVTSGSMSVTAATISAGTINRGTVYFGDSASQDAFGRLKVSQPEPLFDNMSEYGNNPFFWETKVNGAGTITHQVNQNAIRLSTGGTVSGAYAYRATKAYMRYQPGRSLNIETTFVMGTAVTNARTRIGYFGNNNGLFFQRDGTALSFVRRSYTDGTIAETDVPQASWNVDPMNGTGASGITIDVTKSQILFIQLQYLGVGRVQMGFVVNGIPYVAHQFLNTNNLTTVYMSSGCQPIRGEVENTAGAGGTAYMDMICTSVSSGGKGNERIRYSASNGITSKVIGTAAYTPLISLRAGSTFGGTFGTITNRGRILPQEVSILTTGNDTEYRAILNGTLTGASFTTYGADSIALTDTAATAISGGYFVDGGYIPASAQVKSTGITALGDIIPLVYTGLNSTQDTLTIVARTLGGAGTIASNIAWSEEY